MKRTTDEIIEAQAERDLIKHHDVAWREAVRQDPEYRTMPDSPLPDVWYREAQRVAERLGQEAATTMLQFELQRRAHARIDARRAADRARAGVRWHHRLGAGLWACAGATCVAVATHAVMGAALPPHMLVGFWWAFGAIVVVVTVQAACGAQR